MGSSAVVCAYLANALGVKQIINGLEFWTAFNSSKYGSGHWCCVHPSRMHSSCIACLDVLHGDLFRLWCSRWLQRQYSSTCVLKHSKPSRHAESIIIALRWDVAIWRSPIGVWLISTSEWEIKCGDPLKPFWRSFGFHALLAWLCLGRIDDRGPCALDGK